MEVLVIVRLPKLKSKILCARLSKGMGHNYYGEPAWPNDILFIFPVVILGSLALILGVAAIDPTGIGEPGNPFATPEEILPEWYFFPTFDLLRVLPNKFIGVLSMAFLPGILLILPFAENWNPAQNPWRRPLSSTAFLFVAGYSLWLSIGSLQPLIEF